ncbi:MAG: DUF1679 domain-containing protein [Deltaproteobacteria bacterium]|nr:MAG: DUF1679 domain-containing protein [Deltaproteobacteria bacterium]
MRVIGALFFGFVFFFAWFVCSCIVALDRLFKFSFAFPRNGAQLKERRGWCIEQLTRGGALPEGAEVQSLEVESFKADEIFRSQTVLVELSYTWEGETHHKTCLAKFAPNVGSVSNRAMFVLQACHVHEVDFYNILAKGRDLSLPKVFFADCSVATGNLCILMEYCEEHIEHTEEDGCPVEQVPLAIEALAHLHASFWGYKEKEPAWLAPFPTGTIEFFGLIVYVFVKERALRNYVPQVWHRTNEPQTVLHGDARVGNMLFPAVGHEGKVILFDWQGARVGQGVFDVAYFLILSLPADVRIEHEVEWLRLYHAELCEQGVTGYSWDDCLDQYRHSCLMVMVLLGLPWLSGEASAEEHQERRLLSGGVTWAQRLYQMVRHIDDEWLQTHYGFDRETMVRDMQHNLRHPTPLHPGSRQISNYIRNNGGFELLETEEGLQALLAPIWKTK